ncbi:hypothetical protein IMCC3317_30420 [Kordia antarctica]|uniref:Uncharacterized protein n=1 Tax=Kordia antarctica TaxID=1218801 RepID=A0A7L4ZMA7_9FLAO|nr:hypothetical protein [Kordia antarctica]QHI37661.1 hypothetical protein IMCC3317_30420 [Kordia antarctica]
MKKKKLKSLSLKKSSISNLNGGAQNAARPIQLTRNLEECVYTNDIYECTWYSELYSACECEPSWDLGCQLSVDRPCDIL